MTTLSTDSVEANAVRWGIRAQTGTLTDVLLGKPDHFRWVPLNSISAVNQANQEQMGYCFDKQRAMQQHQRMVEVYVANNVRCHFAEADEGLPSSVFTRDSSLSHNVNVNAQLRQEGFDVTAIDYDMYALGGGGVHCSCHELRRE